MIRIRTYVLTLKHDAGIIDIATAASSKEAAINIIMKAELCPRRAIKCVRWRR